MLFKFISLGLAGAAGTIARYLFSGIVQRLVSSDFPLGTAAVNIIGCFLFGLLWASMESRLSISGQTRAIVFIGFFGAFTTFSSYIFETSKLLDQSQWLLAMGNILLQNIIGLACILAGLAIGKLI
ncbi:MAG: fluoride efflux transporter CrcB [Sedimentisphaerales bacterium]|nr:fluoride efflux transporter CrcB [Sedimentisphaerales bacterium]